MKTTGDMTTTGRTEAHYRWVCREGRLFFFSYGALVLLFGLGGGWTRPPTSDELGIYLPAFNWLWQRLPAGSLNYPSQVLPTTLYVQSVIFGTSGESLVAVRVFSSIAVLSVAGVLFLGPLLRPASIQRSALVLTLLCNPFLFWNTFTAKGHALAVSTLLVGVVAWKHLRPCASRTAVALAVGGLTIAGTSSQLALPICAGLLASEILAALRAGRSCIRSCLIAPALPLLSVAVLFAFWGGASPPAWVAFVRKSMAPWMVEAEVARFGNPLPRIVLLLISVGVWLSPMILPLSRRLVIIFLALAWPATSVLVHLSGIYRPGGSFLEVAAGPLSTSLRWASGGSQLLLSLSAGFLAALGTMLFLPESWRPAARGPAVPITLLCCLAATVGVPYLFESYSLYAIMGVGALLLTGEVGERRIAKLHAAAVAGAGVLYASVKLFVQ